MEGDEVDDPPWRPLLIEVTRPVERVEADDRKVRRVADVVHPGRRFEEPSIVTELGAQEPSLTSDGKYMGPTTR
ncbi:hypothetical protein GCM10023204_09040 [Actinomycetospora succinea]